MRLFVAVVPPAAIRTALAAIPRPVRDDVRWTTVANLHVTLRFLGDADETAAAETLDNATLPRATASTGPEVVELRRGLAVAPVAGLDRLAAVVTDATARLGQPPPDRPFVAHITLARVRGTGPTPLIGVPVDHRFDVTEVLLLDSETRPTGAVHSVRGRWQTG